MKTWLVTGGAGFIGGCFVRQNVANKQAKIVCLDKLTYAGNLESLASVQGDANFEFVQGDIADKELVANLFRKHQPSAVINFAAESHVDRSIDGPREFVLTNVLGTFELLLNARVYWESLQGADKSAFRFLHVSTDEVYGSLGPTGLFTETTPYQPNSPYSLRRRLRITSCVPSITRMACRP